MEYLKWTGQLVFSCLEASAPEKALAAFQAILRELPQSRDTVLSPFHIDTAKASLIYRSHNGRSTAGQIITRALQQAMLVFVP